MIKKIIAQRRTKKALKKDIDCYIKKWSVLISHASDLGEYQIKIFDIDKFQEGKELNAFNAAKKRFEKQGYEIWLVGGKTSGVFDLVISWY